MQGGMADIITALVALLGDDAQVTTLAGAHVYGDELPEAVIAAMPRQALVLKASGGVSFQPGASLELETQRIDLFAYGGSPLEADTLRRVASRVLFAVRRQVAAGVLIHWVQSAGGYLTGRDRDGQWPYAFQSLQALFSTEEVSP